MSFDTILIANRGEIAVRIIRTARGLGYRTVAVFSEADRNAPHVQLADLAIEIGAAAPSASYLRIPTIIEAAQRTGAQAVHPGYGFLSENAAFVRACDEAGLTFIGPPADAIDAMGDKAQAKTRMQAAGVPTVPGYFGASQDDAKLRDEAARVGFPLLVKAVSGGGGRGMRLVTAPGELDEALVSARREAQSAFGDANVMLERFIAGGRHVEVQVFADRHGNAIHLGERDCTAQRRRQKVIEEAPSPIVDEAMRAKIGADAVAAAKAIGYVGAGTIELIVDADLNHYFLEMNTRLQVEHPVTEMITGLDLVEWQLRVAAGEVLPLTQDQVTLRGHAIEARLYAEDPYEGFAPQTGRIVYFRPEAVSNRPGIRIDAGVVEGDEVTPHYDPMVAKVIAYGRDRPDAIRRLSAALEDCPLVGLRSNQHFLVELLRDEAFRNAKLDTATLDRWMADKSHVLADRPDDETAWMLAGALLAMGSGDWFRSASPVELAFDVESSAGVRRALSVGRSKEGTFEVRHQATASKFRIIEQREGWARFEQDGIVRRAFALMVGDTMHIDCGRGLSSYRELRGYPADTATIDPRKIVSPIAGTVLRVAVAVGDAVKDGDTVAVIEAMKMETRLTAAASGTVAAVSVKVGDQVEAGAPVAELEEASPVENPNG